MRILLWLALIVAVLFALRKKVQAGLGPATGAAGESTTSGATRENNAPAQNIETMVCCAHCQLHVPASEAVYRDQQAYCCEAHVQQASAH